VQIAAKRRIELIIKVAAEAVACRGGARVAGAALPLMLRLLLLLPLPDA